MTAMTIAADVQRCGAPRLTDGHPCRWRTRGSRCPVHQETVAADPSCTVLAEVVRNIAANTRSGTPAGKAARQVVRVVAAATSPRDARRAAGAVVDPAVRASVARLLTMAEDRAASQSAVDLAWEVEATWRSLQLELLSGDADSDALAAEALAALKARARQLAAGFSRQLADAHARALAAEEDADRHIRRAEALAEHALAGLVIEGAGERFRPHGFFVYLLWGHDDGTPIYVGKSANILNRLGTHMVDPSRRHRIRAVTLIRCKDELTMDRTEDRLIRRYRPELNTAGVPVKDAHLPVRSLQEARQPRSPVPFRSTRCCLTGQRAGDPDAAGDGAGERRAVRESGDVGGQLVE
jgi:hypothetical protein